MHGTRKVRSIALPADRRTFAFALAGTLLGFSARLQAQVPATTRRVGYLSGFLRADVQGFLVLLRPELEKAGWTDGRNIMLLEPQVAEGRNERLPALAAELVAQRPDLILVQTVPAALALVQATKAIPIVMIGVGNPVELGIVADFGRPGGNVTGSSYLANEFGSKLLQLLKEAVPRLHSVAVFNNPTNQHAASYNNRLSADAIALGMRAQVIDVAGEGDLDPAFAAIRRANTESILLPAEPMIMSKRDAIADFAQTYRLPLAVVGYSRSLPASGLLAYGPTRDEYARLAARYVDRILKGAKPGDLPIEQPTLFSIAINLKSAKALGLTIPPSLLARADEVIQ